MKLKIYFHLISFSLFINLISCGGGYFDTEKYSFQLTDDELKNEILEFQNLHKEVNASFINLGIRDGIIDSSSDRMYHYTFYFQDEEFILQAFIRDDTEKSLIEKKSYSNLNLYNCRKYNGVNDSDYKQWRWKIFNTSDLDGKQNEHLKRLFEKRVINPLRM